MDFEIDLIKAGRVDLEDGVVTARTENPQEGLEVMLFVRDGVISRLELTYADAPPQFFPACDRLESPVWHAGF
jgi:hypothetical protein